MATTTKKPATQESAATGDPQVMNLDADGDERQRFRDDLIAAVRAAFEKQEPDPRTHFHEQFRKEADDYAKDFHKKYHDDFNSTLIFAGLFSAVASVFIIDVQSQLRPDYNQMSFTVLTMLLNTTSGIPNHPPPPTWSGPSPTIVQVQSILFASLLSALLAAFLAMLGKQWLNLHVEGSFIDRNRHREQKMRGMITWHFKLVMELLPLSLQVSLLLLGYALAQYLREVNHTVSFVISGFTIVGVVLYLLIVIAGTFSRTSPFQTPFSIALRAILEFCRNDLEGVFTAFRNSFRFTRSQTELIVHRQQLPAPPITSDVDNQDSEVCAELRCILTMFKMTKTPESVKAIMAYITEIVWDDCLKSVPLLQVYQALCESLSRTSDGMVYPRPGARDRALWSAKALLHLYNQRRYTHRLDKSLLNQVNSIKPWTQPLGRLTFENDDEDFDLQSTFYLVDWTFGVESEIPWSSLELSTPHRCWLAHTLRYRAWDTLYGDASYTQKGLTEDVRGFVIASLRSSASPLRVVADCLLIVRMVAGHEPDPRDLLIRDRSHQIIEFIDDIFNRLGRMFEQSTPRDTSSAVEVLELATNLRDRRISARSYSLFRTLVGKADAINELGNELWLPARLCLRGAYSANPADVPQVGDPKQLLIFLRYHMQKRAIFGSRPIRWVFAALVVASNEETERGLAAHSFTDPLFIDTTIEALEHKDFTPLRKSAIFLLVKLDSQLFTTDEAFKDPNRASRFVTAWSSAIHEFLGDNSPPHQVEKAVLKVLLAIAHLPCLREHLPKERWSLLKHFPHIMISNPPPLQRCLKDPDIFPFLKSVTDPRSPPPWLGMLWMMYHHLSPEVRNQLERETRAIAEGQYFHQLTSYIRMFDLYLGNLETRINELDQWDQATSDLQARQERVEVAKSRLISIRDKMSEKRWKNPSFT